MSINESTAVEDLLGVELVDVDFEVNEQVVVVFNKAGDVCVVLGTHGGTEVRHKAYQILAEVGGSCVVDVGHTELRPVLGIQGSADEQIGPR